MLQSGQYYNSQGGHLVYAYSDSVPSLQAQFFSLTYVAGHRYEHEIYFDCMGSGSNTVWMMTCMDTNTSQWAYGTNWTAQGTCFFQGYPWGNPNQSIFFENNNTNVSPYPPTYPWYTGWSTVSANNALEGLGSVVGGVWAGSMSAWSHDSP